MLRKPTRVLLAAVVLSLTAAGCASSAKTSGDTSSPGSSASDVGVTPTTIKVGYISSQTGIASSTSAGAVEGAIARVSIVLRQNGQRLRRVVDLRRGVSVLDDRGRVVDGNVRHVRGIARHRPYAATDHERRERQERKHLRSHDCTSQ